MDDGIEGLSSSANRHERREMASPFIPITTYPLDGFERLDANTDAACPCAQSVFVAGGYLKMLSLGKFRSYPGEPYHRPERIGTSKKEIGRRLKGEALTLHLRLGRPADARPGSIPFAVARSTAPWGSPWRGLWVTIPGASF